MNCNVENCRASVYSRGMCSKHYQRWYRHGDPEMVKPHGRGIQVLKSGGATPVSIEHKRIMAEALGRDLLPDESVRHKNGVRHDNRPENLEIRVSSLPSGDRVEDVLAWADEMIRRYRQVL